MLSNEDTTKEVGGGKVKVHAQSAAPEPENSVRVSAFSLPQSSESCFDTVRPSFSLNNPFAFFDASIKRDATGSL